MPSSLILFCRGNQLTRTCIRMLPAIPFGKLAGSNEAASNRVETVNCFSTCSRLSVSPSSKLPLSLHHGQAFQTVSYCPVREYAKGREKGGNKKKQVLVKEDELAELIDVHAYKSGLEDLSNNLREEFRKQLNVRGAGGALESLQVEFEGENYPLQELAQISRKNPQLVVLSLASLPDALQPVLKALEASGMGLNPQQEGTTIYVPIPKVTREHRENLARNAKTLFTKYKGLYQTLQNRFIKQCRANTEGVSEDMSYDVQQQIMRMASDRIHEAEELVKAKQKELLQQE